MAWEKLESTILPSKVHNCSFLNGKLWKEKEMLKVGIHDLTIQSSFLQLFEKETWKGKWQEKSWNPRSYHPKFITEGFWMENSERKMAWEK